MTATPDQVIANIREALEAGPTPGEWEVYAEKVNDKHDAISEASYQIHYTEPFVGKMFMINAGGKCPAMTGCGPTSEANANWLAAVNPQNIAVLLSEFEALTEELEQQDAHDQIVAALARAEAAEAERDALMKALEDMQPHIDKLSHCVRMGRVLTGQTEAIVAIANIRARTLSGDKS